MKKELENIKKLSKFKQDLINLILQANKENLEKLRKGFPEIVAKFRR